jgi:trans-aconitate methyltransferase
MDYTSIYDPDTDFDVHFTRATGAHIASWLGPGERVLELGCATGAMTTDLIGRGREVVAIARSETYLATARDRGLPGARFGEGDLAHDLRTITGPDPFAHVVAANVLHELDDAAGLLKRIARLHLAPGGLVHVSLQNPASLHRLVALEMGLIDDLAEVAAAGRRYATRRLYSAGDVGRLAADAGLEVAHREGIMLKPLPNDVMATLDPAVLEGFLAAAKHLPEHCAMNLFTLRHAR